jgi:ribose 5-phosphate isomerase A
LSGAIELRGGADDPFETDGGHFILDASFGHIPDASALSEKLLNIPGVVEHGLFLGYAKVVFLASSSGVKQLGDI